MNGDEFVANSDLSADIEPMPAVPVLPVNVIPRLPPAPLHAHTMDATRAVVANAAEKTMRIMSLRSCWCGVSHVAKSRLYL
jgi:hypothetical protein